MIFEELKTLIASELGVNEDDILETSDLSVDLGADSLDAVELIMSIEDQFGITVNDEDAKNLQTVKQIVDYIEKYQS